MPQPRCGDCKMAEPTSVDATQRKLVAGIVIATLMTFAIAIVMLARGGGTDPPALRAAATLLDAVAERFVRRS